MKNVTSIAEDLFNKIRGRFPTITIGDAEGKVTSDPKEARFFDFEYKTGDRKLGRVSVSLDEDNLSVMYTNNFIKEEDTTTRQEWYGFLKELRNFAKKRLLDFDVRDITKNNLDKRDYKFLSQQRRGDKQMSESKMYGTNNVSYQKIGNARLNIKHKHAINTEQAGSRTRGIDKIYIESPEGERFKYPFNHLSGARAMARHVSEGGNPYDSFGQHVVGLSEELSKLKKFKTYVNRSSVMAEGLSQYVEIIEGRAKNIKRELENIQKQNQYASVVENYESIVLEEVPEDVKVNWIDELTIKQFNEELQDIFPYIYRLIGEATKVKELDAEDLEEAVEKIACTECDEVSTAAAWKKNNNFCPKCNTSNKGVAEGENESKTHGNSKIYDKCWDGYRKVPGKKRGEKGSCVKIESEGDARTGRIATDDEAKKALDKLAKMPELKSVVKSLKRRDQDPEYDKKKKADYIKSLSKKKESEEEQDEMTQEQAPLGEFILSHYDRETGSWPKGETAILTSIEKDYGENFIEPSKQFIEKINQTYQQYQTECSCDDNDQEDEIETRYQEFDRLRHLAGL